MFSYYLCDDNDTVYRVGFSIPQEQKKLYLSLLENCLTEVVFVEESSEKKLIKKNKIEKENKESISNEGYMISLEKKSVISAEKIDDDLPYIVTVKTKRYYFLRSCTIYLLTRLLSEDVEKSENPHIKQIASQLRGTSSIHFDLLLQYFFDELGNVSGEKLHDYNAVMSLLRGLEVSIEESYSRSYLLNFWQGDEGDRAVADGIARDSLTNKNALESLNLSLFRGK